MACEKGEVFQLSVLEVDFILHFVFGSLFYHSIGNGYFLFNLCKVASMVDQSRQKVENCNEGTTFIKYVQNSSDNCTKEKDA